MSFQARVAVRHAPIQDNCPAPRLDLEQFQWSVWLMASGPIEDFLLDGYGSHPGMGSKASMRAEPPASVEAAQSVAQGRIRCRRQRTRVWPPTPSRRERRLREYLEKVNSSSLTFPWGKLRASRSRRLGWRGWNRVSFGLRRRALSSIRTGHIAWRERFVSGLRKSRKSRYHLPSARGQRGRHWDWITQHCTS